MAKINLLDSSIYNLIAAGEVVERPSSVIKELIENSIDSGATAIVAEIKRGGVALIRVSDNGCGMDINNLPKAFLPHATSKISCLDDLDKIGTLGFRGEALASIASVSDIELDTSKENEIGTHVEIIKERIKNITGELLKIYKERNKAVIEPFAKDDENQLIFDSEFEYEETPRDEDMNTLPADEPLQLGKQYIDNFLQAIDQIYQDTIAYIQSAPLNSKGNIRDPEFYFINLHKDEIVLNSRIKELQEGLGK